MFGRYDRRYLLVRIKCRMIPFVFPNLMELPVVVEVAARPQGAQAEHGFSPMQAPASACDIHPVFHEMPAGPFDDAGGDRQAGGQGLVILEKRLVMQQVVCTLVHWLYASGEPIFSPPLIQAILPIRRSHVHAARV